MRRAIVLSVTAQQTIGVRVYPHYKGTYINVVRAKNSKALMRKLLNLSDRNFLFWGADDVGGGRHHHRLEKHPEYG